MPLLIRYFKQVIQLLNAKRKKQELQNDISDLNLSGASEVNHLQLVTLE